MHGLAISLIIALSVLLGACGSGSAPSPGETVIRIGSVAPLTGPQAHLGKDNDNGARLAIKEANAKSPRIGGRRTKFELVSEDDQADPKTGTIVAQRLVDEGVNGVVGHLNSGTTIPASKIYADAGIPQISPSATAVAYTSQGFKTAFRIMANDAQQGKVLGDFAVKQLGAKKIAIIDDRSAYGQGLADEFKKAATAAGAQTVTRQYTTDKSTDFLSILTAVKAEKPDLLFYGGMDAQAGPMVKQMKLLGLNIHLLAGDGVQSLQFLSLAGADAKGVIASSPGLPIESMPGGGAFKKKFGAEFGKIQIYAPYAYDAVWAMIEAMQKAGFADPAKYLPELKRINFTGVTGPIRFDDKGDIKGGAITLYQVKNGKWEMVQTIKSGQ